MSTLRFHATGIGLACLVTWPLLWAIHHYDAGPLVSFLAGGSAGIAICAFGDVLDRILK